MSNLLSSNPLALGMYNAFAMFCGSEVGKNSATSAQWTRENVIIAQGAGMILGNMLMAGVLDSLLPESTTFVKVMSVGGSLVVGTCIGYLSAIARLSDTRTWSQAAIETPAKWGLVGLVAGGTLATIASDTIHPAVGALLGGVTTFLIDKYATITFVTLAESNKDQQLL